MSRTTCGNGLIFVAAIWLGLMVTSARGGSLDDPGAPTDPASAMYTAKDIYNRLAFGTNAPKRTGAFTEPTAGPTADTMPTTDEIMAKTPSTNASGAVEGEVLSGKTFWGLTQGAWGTRTGTYEGGGSATNALVPKTGQTNSYATYDDGALTNGLAWPNPRFTVVGALDTPETNQIRDNLTGLIWARDASNACGSASAQVIWGAAVTNCNNLVYGGTNDWRLPNVRELYSLIALQYYSPSLSDGTGTNQWTEALGPFTGVQPNSPYWSSTTAAWSTLSAWSVYLADGRVYFATKATTYDVWPVRGGQ